MLSIEHYYVHKKNCVNLLTWILHVKRMQRGNILIRLFGHSLDIARRVKQ